ncbi:MAG TPA: DUF5013 domain-containing protein, partial [Chitinophagaceae bacterium]|nr:DUF5013 domain-containing protein [Chitinophagaceae bacterium]
LVNRGVSDASMQNNASALITWADISSAAGVQYIEIKYTDSFNAAHDTVVTSKLAGQTSTLPVYKLGSLFTYRTAYLPNATAIDTFYTPYQPHSVKADVTQLYLSNVGPSVQGINYDGRFGRLAAPWIANAGALNKNNGNAYGGWAIDPVWDWWGTAGAINWETWGNTPVVDGKIYQVTALPLPAGSYTLTFHYYSEIQQNSSVYCVIAAGNTGIPSLPNLSTALGYTLLFNGANVGTTTPSATEDKSVNFTITTPQSVSIGFLGNIVGNGNPGSYFRLDYIHLIQN